LVVLWRRISVSYTFLDGLTKDEKEYAKLSPVHTAFAVDRDDYRIDRKEAWRKTNDFVAKLNLTEKFGLVTGRANFGPTGGCIGAIQAIPRLNFPGLCLQDGPQAMNRADLVSMFPSGNSAGSTWDLDLIYKRGQAMGAEFRGKGSHVLLG
jgi:beta-glucosidase